MVTLIKRSHSYVMNFLLFLLVTCPLLGSGTLLKVISLLDSETVFQTSCKWNSELARKSPDGLEGMLLRSNPEDCCVKPMPPMVNGSAYPVDPDWFLIATYKKKDRCTLMTKARLADDAGYAAIVIQYEEDEEVPATAFITGHDFDYSLSIFPCLVSRPVGDLLKSNYTNDNYVIEFEDESIDTWTRFFITTFLALIAILLAIALSYCVVQMFILLVIWIRNTIVHGIEQRRINRRRRLPARQLKKIPIQPWNPDIPQETCTICLENFEENEKVRILPCSHAFHQVCIDPWLLKQRRKCPNCKRKIVFPDEPYASDSSTEDDRAPLIRREGSLDYSIAGGLTFTFNESDFANHPEPIYRAIHRMMRDASSRRRSLEERREQRSSTLLDPSSSAAASPRPGTSQSASSSSSSSPSIPGTSTDAILQNVIRQNRLSRFCPRRKLPRSLFRPSAHSHSRVSGADEYLEDTSEVPRGGVDTSQNPNQDQFLQEGRRAYEESLRHMGVIGSHHHPHPTSSRGIDNVGVELEVDGSDELTMPRINGEVCEISQVSGGEDNENNGTSHHHHHSDHYEEV